MSRVRAAAVDAIASTSATSSNKFFNGRRHDTYKLRAMSGMRRGGVVAVAICAATLCLHIAASATGAVPTHLTDQEFWSLVSELSEPGGSFRSENLLSNELRLQYVIPDLVRNAPRGRAYIGVGPEQNFTY